MAEDIELIRQIAAGQKAAMKRLFDRYEGPLFAFLRSRGADADAADDAIQDAMLDVWRTAGRFKAHASVKTWIFTIARNKFIDALRKTGRFDTVSDMPETADEAPDVDTLLIAANDAVRVRACLQRLKPHHLSSIRLAFFEDQTYAQIGEIEGVSVGTIKARVFHAKRLLMACLGRP